jgi:hypothetical protein
MEEIDRYCKRNKNIVDNKIGWRKFTMKRKYENTVMNSGKKFSEIK